MSQLTMAIDEVLSNTKQQQIYAQANCHLTYGEVAHQVSSLAGYCASHNLNIGDRVVICSQDDAAALALFIAAIRNGLTVVIIDPGAPGIEIDRLMHAADYTAAFLDAEVLAHTAIGDPQAADRPIMVIDRNQQTPSRGLLARFRRKVQERDVVGPLTYPAALATCNSNMPLPAHDDIADEEIGYILFTSGTTSMPKGVMISQRALLAQMRTFSRHYGLDSQTRLMNLLPLHHTDGLTQGGMVTFLNRATLIRPWHFSVDLLPKVTDLIYSERTTHLVTVPSVLALMEKMADDIGDAFDTDDFRFVISTAAHLDTNLWRRFEAQFGVMVVNVYGLTETVCESLYCGPDDQTRRVGTVGKPVDAEARIVNDNGDELSVGEVGELVLRGEHIMSGYFRMPEETKAVLSDDGWFKTGDLARCDADGFYEIVGRKKALIISGGVNIYPGDVVAVLRDIPGVLDAVTFGLPDAVWGERVVSCVVPVPGEHLTAAYVADAFLKRTSRSRLPQEIHVMEDFPRGPAGKVILSEIKDAVAERNTQLTSKTHHGSVSDRVMAIASEQFAIPIDQIKRAYTPQELMGWTSLKHVEFLFCLEQEFGLKLEPRDIMRLTSIGSAIDVIEERMA